MSFVALSCVSGATPGEVNHSVGGHAIAQRPPAPEYLYCEDPVLSCPVAGRVIPDAQTLTLSPCVFDLCFAETLLLSHFPSSRLRPTAEHLI